MLRPETCLVLDDGTGRAVGYLLGAADTASFVDSYETTYLPYLQSLGFEKPIPDDPAAWETDLPTALKQIMFTPEGMLHREHHELLAQWPAHLHVDILPPYQKQGYGRQLIKHYCTMARVSGAIGIHLLMATSNEEAQMFYDRVGFKRFPYVLDDGNSGQHGRDRTTIWLVKDL
ncbi:hypothetical protein A1O1_03015 [Capronia coronata CBS 617.96]|uniref:N-acetyltransferase domain-containing protein n=1 Tax=Capronia coronata CBS 617.96 TaxID=1182541 RepID=W9ZJE2_9EURO|nr:uncharacterized protein A1O1_03015 [Capronia coronata CBS 617.96]EXJ94619.1 hypothetical protein A1O1_03015 [Capronia coronata CBS 617.96]